MPLILGANSVSGYTVKNSLRFNSGSSDYLNRTPASSGSLTTWTISLWVKRANISSAQQMLFMALPSASNDTQINFSSGDQIEYFNRSGGSVNAMLLTNQLFRDVSAWYHLVFVWDTNNATAGDRMRMYVNGSEITSFATDTNPSSGLQSKLNQNTEHRIGQATSGSASFNGYISDCYFIDGQALTPSSFGETDTLSGIWIPKAYTGTYGTNGFFLKFSNSASLGTDSSGNGNNFTVNNLTSVDQSTDTPTNNFATFNSLIPNSSITYSEGNLSMVASDGTLRTALSTIAVSAGKWYAEFKIQEYQDEPSIGVIASDSPYITNVALRQLENSTSYRVDGIIFQYSNSQIDTGEATFTTGDIIGVALDMDNSKVYFSKNGTFINSANPANGTNGYSITSGKSYHFAVSQNYVKKIYANFGSPIYSANSYTDSAGYGNFSYQVPANYYSLCTKNLAQFG